MTYTSIYGLRDSLPLVPKEVSKSLNENERGEMFDLYHNFLHPLVKYKERSYIGLFFGFVVGAAVYCIAARTWPFTVAAALDSLSDSELGRVALVAAVLTLAGCVGAFFGSCIATWGWRGVADSIRKELVQKADKSNALKACHLLTLIRDNDPRPEYRGLASTFFRK